MSKPLSKKLWKPEFRHRCEFPAPPIEEIEARLQAVLTPGSFAPLRMADQRNKLRERVLTLPVMTAIVVSLVFRKMPSLAEVLRVLSSEGLLWVEALRVSKQALSQRLESLPSSLFGRVFQDVISRQNERACAPLCPDPEQTGNQGIVDRFGAVWIADGSTLEALKRKLGSLKEEAAVVLGGKMMMLVSAFSHRPVFAWYTDDAKANDKSWTEALLSHLPEGGLLIFDLGFFSFLWFDAFTEAKKFFVTRLRQKTAFRILQVLSQGPCFSDAIIELGQYRSNPCKHRVRLVSALFKGTWYYYLTNVLDPRHLSAKQVCELYRRRWRIEQAFLLTKRLLGLEYLWVGGKNGVEIQVYATWIFYAVLTDLCQQVANALSQPLERISVEMVFRGLYHFSRAVQRGAATCVAAYLSANAKLLGLVKAVRKRHRQLQSEQQDLWEPTLT